MAKVTLVLKSNGAKVVLDDQTFYFDTHVAALRNFGFEVEEVQTETPEALPTEPEVQEPVAQEPEVQEVEATPEETPAPVEDVEEQVETPAEPATETEPTQEEPAAEEAATEGAN